MLTAILQALLVTFLWSTSWVLIKIGLGSIPPITFAGLRYTLAFLLLLAVLLRPERRKEIAQLSRREWGALLLLGLVYYTFTQGAQFLGLVYLNANTLSLMLTLSVVTIALAGRLFLGEGLAALQWVGVLVSIAGALIYFGNFGEISTVGVLAGAFAVLANTGGAILGRDINRRARISPLVVTVVSMGIGSLLLLAGGLLAEPFPSLSARDGLIILWLAAVNTAFAFTLWNRTLRILTAAQSGVINNTMLIQIAILAWVFLGERLTGIQIAGLLVAALGAVMVQVRWRQDPIPD